MSTGFTPGLEVTMPSMPPKDTSMLDRNRNTIKIRKNQTLFFVSVLLPLLTNFYKGTYAYPKNHMRLEYFLHFPTS